MILIADSGSTKTDWRYIDKEGAITPFNTIGLNPLFTDKETIVEAIKNATLTAYASRVEAIYFYGAGLINNKAKEDMKQLFLTLFGTNTKIYLHDDMHAAAIALFGKGSGIACILGTGSNSCFFKDGQIEDKVPALGYVLGDEGSGANLGIRFVNALLKRRLPDALHNELCNKFNLSQDYIIEQVYKQAAPNRFLASLTKIVYQYIHHKEMQNIVREAFGAFISNNIAQYSNYKNKPIAFVGSIAYYFKDLLEQEMQAHQLTISKLLQSPIDGLTCYHNL